VSYLNNIIAVITLIYTGLDILETRQ